MNKIKVYFLELVNSINNYTYPAVFAKDKETIFCKDKALLKKVWKKLVPREAVIKESFVSDDTYILSVEGFKEMCKKIPDSFTKKKIFWVIVKKIKPTPFMWKPGLLTPVDSNISSPFVEEKVTWDIFSFTYWN
jgi:hypothetical protein